MNSPAVRPAVEIRIANVSLPAKLDAIATALDAIREAHRQEITPECWAAINRARREIAAAMMSAPVLRR